MSTRVLKPAFVEAFPPTLEPCTFYIAAEFNSCAHLCACGCGQEVITPLSPAQWSFTYNGQNVSVRPSVGNWSLECRSHYVIDNGRVVWSRTFSDEEIASNRARDRRAMRRLEHQSTQLANDTAPDPATSSACHQSPRDPIDPTTTASRSTASRSEAPAGLWQRLRRAIRRAGR